MGLSCEWLHASCPLTKHLDRCQAYLYSELTWGVSWLRESLSRWRRMSECLLNTAESWEANRSVLKIKEAARFVKICTFQKKALPPTVTLPHFSSQEGQLKAWDLYFPLEVIRSLLYWPNAHIQQLRSNCKKTFWGWLFFFYCNIQLQETGANIVYFKFCFLLSVPPPG